MSPLPETSNQNSSAEPNLRRNNTKQQQVHRIRPSAELFQDIQSDGACAATIPPVQCAPSGSLVMIIHHVGPAAAHHLLAATQRTFSIQPARRRRERKPGTASRWNEAERRKRISQVGNGRFPEQKTLLKDAK